MISRNELFNELNYGNLLQELLLEIENGLKINNGKYTLYYYNSNRKIPDSIILYIIEYLKELEYFVKSGIQVLKGKYLEISI